MAQDTYTVFTVSIASGLTLSAEVDLGQAYQRIYAYPVNLASEVRFQIAEKLAGTYGQLLFMPINSSTVSNNIVKIGSAASAAYSEIPAGYRYMKVETTAAVANGGTCKILCSEY